jgi:Tfp pilus assembly protein PilE
MKLQRGFSLNALMIGGAAIGVLALLAMKIVPEYMEFGTVVKTVKATAADTSLKDASVAQVRTSFAKRAEIDSIKSISEKDLDITKEGGELVISFAYTKKVPLFKNVSLVFDFEGASNK